MLPAAERSISRRKIDNKIGGAQKGPFRDQIPLLLGPLSPLCPPSPKTPFRPPPQYLRNLYFYSGFARNPPNVRESSQMPKRHLPESAVTRGRLWGGDFCTPFFWAWFLVGSFWPLQTMEALEIPYFVVFSLVSCFRFFRLPEPPPHDIFIDWRPFSNFGLKNARKLAKHRGQIVWPEFPPRVLGAFTVFLRQNCFPSADRVLAQKGVLSRNPSFSSGLPPPLVLQPDSWRKGGDQIPLLKALKKKTKEK